MTIEHSVIADPNIHEPKDIASAINNQVYTANGTGSGTWATNSPNNEVVINSPSDFPAPSGGEIQLEDGKTYTLGGDILLTDTLRLGVDNKINGNGELSTSSVNGLFVGGDFGIANLDGLRIACSTGPLFTLEDIVTPGSSILSMVNFFCETYVNVGTFTNLLGVQIQGGNFNDLVNSVDGALFVGNTFAVISMREVLFITNTGAGFIAVDLGTAVSNTLELSNLEVFGVAGTVGLNGAAASANVPVGSLANVTSCNLEGAGGIGTGLTGITEDDIRWDFKSNAGIADTYPDGLVSMVGNSTVTTIATVNTPVLVAGTFTVEGFSQFTGTAAGRLTYNGERDIRAPISASIALEPVSGTNKDLRVYVAINGTEVTNSGKTVRASNASPLAITVIWQETMSQNDFVEIFIENTTDAVDITVTDAVLRLR